MITLALIFLASGCSTPSAANIELRKQNQSLRDQIDTLTRARLADQATIAALESKSATTAPTLPFNQLENLYTVHGLQLGKLTGGLDSDPAKPGDEGLKIQALPTDQDGEPLKAAGTFVVEAFDLAQSPNPAIGKWSFDLAATKAAWSGSLLSHQYTLKCPWQSPPLHEELTVKITFTDELTHRSYSQQKVVRIKPPK